MSQQAGMHIEAIAHDLKFAPSDTGLEIDYLLGWLLQG